jgi:hypothetical protein
MRLEGTEEISIELDGELDPAGAEAFAKRLPTSLRVDADAFSHGYGRVSILVLQMRGLGLRRVPLLPGADYLEVLYRLSIVVGGVRAWLAVRCDLDRAAIRATASRVIRYPVQSALIEILTPSDEIVAVRERVRGASLEATLRLDEETDAAPTRRTFVMQREQLYEIPWDERTTTRPRRATVEDVDTSACTEVFGAPVTITGAAIVHRGRRHFCASAVAR